jgi:hypothetical protein
MRAWLQGTNDDFREAQYEQFCRDGYVFSIVLFAVVPILTITIALICCCCSPASGIMGQNNVCEDAKIEKTRTRSGINRQGTRYVRKTSRRNKQDPDEIYIKKATSDVKAEVLAKAGEFYRVAASH